MRSIEELFPERHLYVRSGGEMRGYVLTTGKQLMGAGAVAVTALWMGVCTASMLVNALSMMAPYGAAEKQALLEAPDLKTRADTLIAITEIALARDNEDFGSSLQ